MKEIATYSSKAEAEVVHSKLESYGIESIIEADDILGLPPSGGVRILVDEKDYDKACELLKIKKK